MTVGRLGGVALVAWGLGARAAGACPSCFSSSGEEMIRAYQTSTLALSLLPFALVAGVGGVAWMFARRGDGDPADAGDGGVAGD